MKVTIELEQSDLDALHDVILEALDYSVEELTDELIMEYWKGLPQYLKDDAARWGCDDSVVRDNIYVWIKEKE